MLIPRSAKIFHTGLDHHEVARNYPVDSSAYANIRLTAAAVLEALGRMDLQSRVLQLGLPDRFVDHGDPASLIAECGLDAAGIGRSIRKFIS